MLRLKLFLLMGLGLAALVPSATIAQGAVDPSFGVGGRAVFTFAPDRVGDVFAARSGPGGRLLVAGDVGSANSDSAVARLTSRGRLDASFAGDGTAVLPLSPRSDEALGVDSLPGGGLVLTGAAVARWSVNHEGDEVDDYDAFVVRLQPNGAPDAGFGNRGVVTLRTGRRPDAFEQAQAALALPDGRLLVAGTDDQGVFLAQLLPDGRPNPLFGEDGVARPFPRARQFFVEDLLVDGPGRVVLVGEVVRSGGVSGEGTDTRDFDFAAGRVNVDGRPDLTFGRRGLALIPAGDESGGLFDDDLVSGAGIRAGRVVLAGVADGNLAAARPVVVRLRRDGRVDRTFGRRGWWRGRRRAEDPVAGLDSRGRTWLAGATRRGMAVRRLTAAGRLDRGFAHRAGRRAARRGRDAARARTGSPRGGANSKRRALQPSLRSSGAVAHVITSFHAPLKLAAFQQGRRAPDPEIRLRSPVKGSLRSRPLPDHAD
ncbi:MAG: hypothetical protein M3P48_01305 [Actinomycetota bacterium]|nr:hypothetical protein [Actinomycetota bacterium]